MSRTPQPGGGIPHFGLLVSVVLATGLLGWALNPYFRQRLDPDQRARRPGRAESVFLAHEVLPAAAPATAGVPGVPAAGAAALPVRPGPPPWLARHAAIPPPPGLEERLPVPPGGWRRLPASGQTALPPEAIRALHEMRERGEWDSVMDGMYAPMAVDIRREGTNAWGLSEHEYRELRAEGFLPLHGSGR